MSCATEVPHICTCQFCGRKLLPKVDANKLALVRALKDLLIWANLSDTSHHVGLRDAARKAIYESGTEQPTQNEAPPKIVSAEEMSIFHKGDL